jgi:hypothetical protein
LTTTVVVVVVGMRLVGGGGGKGTANNGLCNVLNRFGHTRANV